MSEITKTPITLEDLRQHRESILRIAEKHGASNVRVFGSVARDEATIDSDIDFLVDQDWAKLSAWGGVGLTLDLSDLLQTSVDVTTVEELKPAIRDRVLAEAIPL